MNPFGYLNQDISLIIGFINIVKKNVSCSTIRKPLHVAMFLNRHAPIAGKTRSKQCSQQLK